ncbi:hypothetical protein [uncultured Ruegeria sp.]|uniref:hypothetical protein n=1 Tax=uncultured Ruegeria sp. TaxID=259304 RepID=UPI0026079289|nr:hypothetical protein [uncultured Ruegeria sp.]
MFESPKLTFAILQKLGTMGSNQTFDAADANGRFGPYLLVVAGLSAIDLFVDQRDLDKPNATGRQGEGAALRLGQPY